jgi:hypothetical protein
MVSLSLMLFFVLVAFILGLVTTPLVVYMRLVKPTALQPLKRVNRQPEI